MSTYWSLGYEAPYYVIAGLFVLCRGPGRFVWPLMIALFVGPNILTLMPIWLLGTAIYKLRHRLIPSVFFGLPLFVLPIVAFFVARQVGFFEPIAAGIGGSNSRLQLEIIYVSAVLFALHLAGAQMLSRWLASIMAPARKAIRWGAGGSFTLYLLHVPIAYFIAAHDPWKTDDIRSMLLFMIGTPVTSYVIAAFTERRKTMWRRLFGALLPP
jgi:peptidoglycan/LPS O-acetylase OafA/YrhL